MQCTMYCQKLFFLSNFIISASLHSPDPTLNSCKLARFTLTDSTAGGLCCSKSTAETFQMVDPATLTIMPPAAAAWPLPPRPAQHTACLCLPDRARCALLLPADEGICQLYWVLPRSGCDSFPGTERYCSSQQVRSSGRHECASAACPLLSKEGRPALHHATMQQ